MPSRAGNRAARAGRLVEVDLHVRGEDERGSTSYPDRASSSKRQRRIISASVSSIVSNWAAVTGPPSSMALSRYRLHLLGASWASLEVQTARAKGLVRLENVPRARDETSRPLAGEGVDRPSPDPRTRACAPHPAGRATRGRDRGEKPCRVPPTVAVVEPRCRGAPPDELDVHVRPARRRRTEADGRSGRRGRDPGRAPARHAVPDERAASAHGWPSPQ